jgi:phage baseplate assembly protein W
MPVPPTILKVAFPYRFDGRGRTAQANEQDHIRDLIEQVLFTAPGERVNRPDFGCGLLQLVFAPNSGELATATQFLVQGALQQSLGDIINLTNVVVSQADSTLTVTVQYTIRDTQQQVVAQFVRGGLSA